MPAHAVPFIIAIIAAFAAFMLALGGSALWSAGADKGD